MVLNTYKQWLQKNSHRLQDTVHVDNYRKLFGEAPFISVKELIKYSSAQPKANQYGSPLIQNTSLPPPNVCKT